MCINKCWFWALDDNAICPTQTTNTSLPQIFSCIKNKQEIMFKGIITSFLMTQNEYSLVDSLHANFFFCFLAWIYVNALGTGRINKTAWKNFWLLKSYLKFHPLKSLTFLLILCLWCIYHSNCNMHQSDSRGKRGSILTWICLWLSLVESKWKRTNEVPGKLRK